MTGTRIDALVAGAEQRWRDGWPEGPQRLRWTGLPPQVGNAAPDAALSDHTGRTLRLSERWRERPLLLLFWRHFGCSCGTDRAARLREELPAYADAGAVVLLVTQGEPERAALYREQQQLDVDLLCDVQREVYAAYGLLDGTPAQVLFDAPDEYLRLDPQAGQDLQASRHGSPRAAVDSPWQLPGEFVIGTDGTLRLALRYGWCEDYPDHRVHVAALRAAAGPL